MVSYNKGDARGWARENLKGVANVIIPSFTSDLAAINERAVQHDAAKNIEYGFSGTLAVSEVAITLPEYRQFCEILVDSFAGRQHVIHHASWSSYEQNLEALKIAEEAGAELVLLSYPPNFYPKAEREIYDYTKAICDATNLAVMLFPMSLWGFSTRIHPSDIPVSLIRRLIDDCPNIVAIKAEGGYPSVMGLIECNRHFADEVVISCPLEYDLQTIGQLIPFQYSSTSDHEFYGPMIPRIFNLLQAGNLDEVTRLYWQMHPARTAKAAAGMAMHGGASLNRHAWKFQAWLQGYNGGPMRMPTMRIHDPQMNTLRKGLIDAGLEPSMDPFSEFFIGRHPN